MKKSIAILSALAIGMITQPVFAQDTSEAKASVASQEASTYTQDEITQSAAKFFWQII